MARVVIAGTPHHVVQRGNRRQRTFFSEDDYGAYLHFAAEAFAEADVEVWSYCLMPNHVHLIATPRQPTGLAEAVGNTHRSYSRYVNQRENWTGFLWQGRFASFPMDDDYLRTCFRYVGLNPVRAGLVAHASEWPWSSVRAHLGGHADPLLTPEPFATLVGDEASGFFDVDVEEEARRALREASGTGRPLGAKEWGESLERAAGKRLTARPVGRPRVRTVIGDTNQFPSG